MILGDMELRRGREALNVTQKRKIGKRDGYVLKLNSKSINFYIRCSY